MGNSGLTSYSALDTFKSSEVIRNGIGRNFAIELGRRHMKGGDRIAVGGGTLSGGFDKGNFTMNAPIWWLENAKANTIIGTLVRFVDTTTVIMALKLQELVSVALTVKRQESRRLCRDRLGNC